MFCMAGRFIAWGTLGFCCGAAARRAWAVKRKAWNRGVLEYRPWSTVWKVVCGGVSKVLCAVLWGVEFEVRSAEREVWSAECEEQALNDDGGPIGGVLCLESKGGAWSGE